MHPFLVVLLCVVFPLAVMVATFVAGARHGRQAEQLESEARAFIQRQEARAEVAIANSRAAFTKIKSDVVGAEETIRKDI